MFSSGQTHLTSTIVPTERQRRIAATRRQRMTPGRRLHNAVAEALEPRTLMAATHLAFAIQPIDTTAGEPLASVTVNVEDGNNAIVTSSSALVTFSIASGPSGADPLFFAVPAVNGVATLSGLSFTVAGNYTLQATATGLTADISDAFAINPDVATHLTITAAPSNGSAGNLNTVTVEVRDQFENVVTTDSSNVIIALASGSGTLLGTKTIAASSGVATFSTLGIHEAGAYTVTVTDGALDADTSGSFTVSPAAAHHLTLAQSPSSITAGGTLADMYVEVRDQYENVVTSDSSTITIAVNSGSGSLIGTATHNASAGAVTFSGLSITRADNYTLTITDGSLTAATTASFTVNPAAAHHLAFTTQPVSATVGSLADVVVEVQDQYNNIVTSDSSSVELTLSGNAALGGTTTVAAVNGVATFDDLLLAASGSYTMSATDGALNAATSSSFTMTPGAANQLEITTQPTTTAAGQTISSVVVKVEDQFGNVVTTDSSNVTISINTGSGTLLGTKTVAAVNGIATFSTLSIAETGSFTLLAHDGSLNDDVSASFSIGAAPAHHLVITQDATNTVAGQTISSIIVEVRDQYDNVVTTDTSSVTIAIASGTGTLLGTKTVNAVAGIATFSTLSIQRTGSFTLSTTDGSLTADTTASFSITPAAANHLTISSQPTTTVAGETLSSIVVQVRDQYENVVTTDTSSITISVLSGGGALSGTDTVAAVSGVATFADLSITTADVYTFSVDNGSVSGTSSSSLTITPAAAAKLIITDQATNTVAGQTISTLTVEVQDQYDNRVTTDTSAVTIAINTGTGTLNGTKTVNAVAGTATFSTLSINTTGSFTLSVTDGSLTSDTGNSFNITPAAASQMVITTGPGNTVAGQTIADIIAKIEDQYGNVVTTSSANVSIAVNSGGGSLAGTTTVAAVNGVATFSGLSMTLASTKTLNVTSSGLTTATSSSFAITPDAADRLAITTPADGTVGSLGTIVVTVQDQYGNTVTGDTSTVSIDIDFGSGTLLGTASKAAVAGVATFTNLAIHEAGSFTLSASDGSLTGVTSNMFELDPGAASQLSMNIQPITTHAGVIFTGSVFVLDQYGNQVLTDNSQVTVSLSDGNVTLNGTKTVSVVNGEALFNNLTVTRAGDYTLHFVDGSLTATDSASFTILANGADHLSFSTGPVTTVAGHTMANVVVSVLDSYGNVADTDTSDVTITIFSGPGSFASGTATVSAVAGVATFNDLVINTAGSYVLRASDSGLANLNSSSFTITPDAATKVVFSTPPASGSAGNLNTIEVRIKDQYNNVVTTDTSLVTLSIASGSGSLIGTATANAVLGIATFSGLAIHVADAYTLSADDGSLTSATSASFTISPAAASKLIITQQPPTTTVAGQTISDIIVEVRDQYDNLVTTDSSNVTIALNTGTGTLSGTKTVAASGGIATFTGLSMTTAGSKTFTITDGSLTSATSNSATISPDAADHLSITTQPANTSAGALGTIVVQVRDQYENVVTTDTSTVDIAMASGGGTLLGTASVAVVNGVATFSALSIHTPGTFTLNVTDGSLDDDTTSSFTISPAAATQVVFTTQPGNISAGALGTVVAKVEDQYGNVVTTDTSTVTLSISGSGVLLGAYSVAAVNGVATFNAVTIHTAGTFTLGASDGGLSSATSNSFTVSPTAATQLAFTSQPTSMVAGNLLTGIQVSIEDQYGNLVNSSQNITFNVTGGGSTFNFVIAAVNGVATLNSIYLVKAGAYGVKATRSGLTAANSNIITVTPDVATKLVITSEPSNTVAGQSISSVVVKVEDQFDNVVTTDTSSISIALASGTGTLNGTTTVAATNGVATFSNLSINTTGAYTLGVTDGALDVDTSASFSITPAAASQLVITTQPAATVAGQTMSNIVVKVEDQYGNVVTTDSSNVTIALNGTSGTLNGTKTVAASSGVATFSTLNMQLTGSYTLSVTDGSLTSATSNSFTITPDAATKVVFTTAPASGSAGGLNVIVAKVLDQYNNVVTTDTSAVDIAIDSGAGSLIGTTSVNAVAGVATFTGLSIQTPDTYTLSITDGSLTGATSSSFVISPSTATHMVITQDASDAVAGQTLASIIVELRDQFDNLVTGENSSVTIAISSGTLSGTKTVAAVNGVATFNALNVQKVGTYSLSISDGLLTGATTSSFTITPSSASQLVITTQPTTTVAGQTISNIVAKVEDAYGNVVTSDSSNVTIAIASGTGALIGTTTVAASSGIATFSTLSMTSSGSFTLSVTDGGLTPGTTSSFTISPDVAHHLSITTQPSNVAAGASNTAVAKVLDQYGNVVTGDTSAVTISIASGTGTLLGTTTVNAVAGVATFSGLSIQKSGSFTLSVADGSLTGATSSSFTVSAAAASQVVFTSQPSTGVAGASLSTINVAIEDQYGNVVTSSSANVNLSINSGGVNLSLNSAASSGVASFSGIALTKTGTFTFRATSTGLTLANSNSFSITPDTATKLVFTTQPSSGTAGSLGTIAVSVEDQYDNVVTTDTSTVTLALASGTGTLLGNATAAAVNGVATFSGLAITTAGSYTLAATDGSLTAETSSSFTLSAGAATQVVFTTQPTTTVAGQTISSIVAKVEDQYGNVVTTDTSSVTIALNGTSGSLAGTKTVSAVSGVATFSGLSMNTAGSYTIRVTDGSLTGDTTSSFTITPAAASQVVITTQPTTTVAGQTISSIVAKVEDQYGNVVTGDASNVTIAVGTGSGTLSGTTTVAAVAGVATFSNLSIAKTGSYTLSITDGSLTSATTSSFTVTPATATHLAFTAQPSSGIAGSLGTITVAVEDQYNNVVTTDTSAVTLALASGTGTLTGTKTVNAVAGVATFTGLSINTAGSYSISATDGSLTQATTSSFALTVDVPTHLVITQGPTTTVAGQTISTILVAVADQYGNIVTTDASTVTIAIATGTGTLGGTTTAVVENGIATFSDLTITKTGSFTLQVTDGSLTSATTSSFTITPDAANHISITTQPVDSVAGATLNVVVKVLDQYGNVVTGDTSDVTIALNTDTTVLNGTTTVAAVNGVATFSDLSINRSGTYGLNVTDGSFSDESDSFVISPSSATQLVIVQGPTTTVAGQSISSVVAWVEDQYGNLVSTSFASISIALTTDTASLAGTTTVTADAGVATFSGLSMTKAGTYTLRVTAGNLTAGLTDTFVVTPDVADHIALDYPTTTVAGETMDAIVATVLDQYGNTVTDFSGEISIDFASANTLTGTTTVSAENGVATFGDLAITKAATYSFTVTSGDVTTLQTPSLTITPDAASQVVFTTGPVNTAAGHLIPTITAKIEDQYGNVITNATDNVAIAISSGSGTLLGTATANAVAGVATFSGLSIRVADEYTLEVSTGELGVGTSDSFTISPDSAAKLVITQQPGTQANNTLSELLVEVRDQYDNLVTDNTSNVTVSIATGGGTLSGTKTVAAEGGIATFSDLAVSKNATFTLKVTDGSLTQDTSDPFVIGAKLVFQKQPGATVAGNTIGGVNGLKILIQDPSGKTMTNESGVIMLTIANGPEGSDLSGTLEVEVVNGVATFNDLSITKAGAYKLIATGDNVNSVTSVSFNVVPAAVAEMIVLQDTSDVVAGVKMGAVKVQLVDAFGNIAVNNKASITLAISDGPTGGTITGTTKATVTNGIATFSSLVFKKAGNYTLTATGAGLTVDTSSFDVTAAAAKKLAFLQQPTGTSTNSNINPAITVQVQDAFGNLVTSSSASVTLAVQSGPTGAFTPVTLLADSGLVTFSGISLSKKGTYKLKATSTGLTLGASNSFVITIPAV